MNQNTLNTRGRPRGDTATVGGGKMGKRLSSLRSSDKHTVWRRVAHKFACGRVGRNSIEHPGFTRGEHFDSQQPALTIVVREHVAIGMFPGPRYPSLANLKIDRDQFAGLILRLDVHSEMKLVSHGCYLVSSTAITVTMQSLSAHRSKTTSIPIRDDRFRRHLSLPGRVRSLFLVGLRRTLKTSGCATPRCFIRTSACLVNHTLLNPRTGDDTETSRPGWRDSAGGIATAFRRVPFLPLSIQPIVACGAAGIKQTAGRESYRESIARQTAKLPRKTDVLDTPSRRGRIAPTKALRGT
jgi:hypothetical protein